jgi:hypothetical protein
LAQDPIDAKTNHIGQGVGRLAYPSGEGDSSEMGFKFEVRTRGDKTRGTLTLRFPETEESLEFQVVEATWGGPILRCRCMMPPPPQEVLIKAEFQAVDGGANNPDEFHLRLYNSSGELIFAAGGELELGRIRIR